MFHVKSQMIIFIITQKKVPLGTNRIILYPSQSAPPSPLK